MTESTFRLLSLLLSVLVAAGVLWNGIQIARNSRQIAELAGKVDALSEVMTAHVNAPGLHGD